MHHLRFRCVCALFPAVVLLAAACSKNTPEKTAALPAGAVFALDDTLTLREACNLITAHLCAVLCSCDTSSLGFFNSTLDSTAEAMTKNLGVKKTGPEALDRILYAVFKSWGIGFDPRSTVTETLLPHLVFRNRKGACLGVSLIILMLAEKLGCPVYGVMLPGHFFCRYDNNGLRINIEPNRQGCDHPDEYYRKRYSCEHQPGYSLACLDKKAVIAVLCYNAGSLCLKRKEYDAAIGFYRESLRRVPGFAEATGNCAVSYAKKNNLDTALSLFDELFTAHPDMVNLAINYGYVAAAAKQYTRALTIYKKGLEYFPDDTVLLKRSEKLTDGINFIGKKKKNE